MKTQALRAALPHTLPVLVGFLVLGASYGFLMQSQGLAFLYTLLSSLFIFAGSMQFVSVGLLLAGFEPLHVFLLTLMINARHLFYGLALLEKYRGLGWKKPYLIFGLCDETFSIHCAVDPPPGVDKGWFYFFITLLDQRYWVAGSVVGALLGQLLPMDTTGLEFVMTALFVVIFLNQWDQQTDHRPALIGAGGALASLALFGSEHFLLPAMGLMVLCLAPARPKTEKEAHTP